jgi:hypothetical protein
MMQGSAGARETVAPFQLQGGAHTPYPEPTPTPAPATSAALPVYTPTPWTCSDAIIMDMTFDGEATWKSFLVKFTRLARSQQWTDDEQYDHILLLTVRAFTTLADVHPQAVTLLCFGAEDRKSGLYALDGQSKNVEEAVDRMERFQHTRRNSTPKPIACPVKMRSRELSPNRNSR